jgi:hypothetical protein
MPFHSTLSLNVAGQFQGLGPLQASMASGDILV